jgi:type II restriction enzyme
LKSHKGPLGRKIPDGAFEAKRERLAGNSNPNLFLLRYDLKTRSVVDLCTVPKHFFALEIIEKRKPLAPTARRAGWVGSNILLDRLPQSAKIFVVQDGKLSPKDDVLAAWKRTLFLRRIGTDARGWLIEVMQCLESIGKPAFTIEEVYAFEEKLSLLYPQNRHVRPKIRQQLQLLRDNGYLEFTARGKYRLVQS